MRILAFALLLGLGSAAHAQDAVQSVLGAAPQLVRFAGSPQNFSELVLGLTEGRPARLSAPAAGGFSRVTTIQLPVKLGAAQAAAVLERARQDLELQGVAQPTPEQLGAALAGVLPQRARPAIGSRLEPDPHPPSPDERAFAQLPAGIQSLLAGMPPREALLKVELAQQHLIALGNPHASPEGLHAMVENVLAPPPGGYSVASASAGATTFPPMSPLVAPYLPALR